MRAFSGGTKTDHLGGFKTIHPSQSLRKSLYISSSSFFNSYSFFSWRNSMSKDVSKYLRPATLPMAKILAAEKKAMTVLYGHNKKSKVYPLWQRRFISYPESWLVSLPAKGRSALIVGLMLWQQYRLNHGRQPLKLTGTMRRKFGLNRIQVRRALLALEKAGVITVERFRHRSPLITLVEKDYFDGRGG
jgi:hypothetical protein